MMDGDKTFDHPSDNHDPTDNEKPIDIELHIIENGVGKNVARVAGFKGGGEEGEPILCIVFGISVLNREV